MFKITNIVLIFCVGKIVADLNGPRVKVKQGILVGKIETTDKGRTFKAFTGIPFAKPPVGDYRFEPPQPVDCWDGTYDATRPHNVCPQMDIMYNSKDNKIIGNEDCLYLNVYVPQLPGNDDQKTLPVMVFIHGGAWSFGSGGSDLYGPEYLLDKDIVLVTVNYRLGPLGFFTTEDTIVPGNNGLKDQAFALKWVKENIAYFGGDSESITLFGQSAGGSNVHYQALSPLNKGLIKGVISQSGTALNLGTLDPTPVIGKRSRALGGLVGCSSHKTIEIVECLKKVKAYDIINATQQLGTETVSSFLLFKPIIEPANNGAFLTRDPLDIMRSGEMKNVAFMTGITADDGTISMGEDAISMLNKDFIKVAPDYLGYRERTTLKDKNKISEDVKEFYFKKQPIDESKRSTVVQVHCRMAYPNLYAIYVINEKLLDCLFVIRFKVWKMTYSIDDLLALILDGIKKAYNLSELLKYEMFTDAIFLVGAHVSVEMHIKYSEKPVYYYLFNYRGTESYCDAQFQGVCHTDDLLYLFKHNLILPNFKPNESERKMIDLMTTLWTNFATYGDPTPCEDPSISAKWKPAKKDKRHFYHLKRDGTSELQEGLNFQRAEFWKMLVFDS